jgi:hypothetical protein
MPRATLKGAARMTTLTVANHTSIVSFVLVHRAEIAQATRRADPSKILSACIEIGRAEGRSTAIFERAASAIDELNPQLKRRCPRSC